MSDTQIIELDEPEPVAARVPWRAGSLTIVLAPVVVVALVGSLVLPQLAGRATDKPGPTAAGETTFLVTTPIRGSGVLTTAVPLGTTPFNPTTPFVTTPGGPASAESGNAEVLETQSWTTFGLDYAVRGDVAEAVLRGAAYVIGGTGTLLDGLHVYRYDLRTGLREAAPDLPVSLDHAMAATLNDRIYVFGGYIFGRPTDRVFSLSANDARWIEHSPMPAARAAGGTAVVGDRIYVVGGVTENGNWIRDTWAFDTSGRWWTNLARIPTPRDHLAVGAYRGRVCAAGGNGANQVFECFDPARNEWGWMPDLRKPVVGGRAVEAAGWFWVVGQDVHIFTIDHWHFGPRPRAPRVGHALVALDDTLYVIEGGLGPASGRMEMLRPQP